MYEMDVINVIPFFFLIAIVTVYAILAAYTGIVIEAHTCKECGKTMPSDESFDRHMRGHSNRVIKFPIYSNDEQSKIAA